MQLETYSFIKRPASYNYEFYSDGPKEISAKAKLVTGKGVKDYTNDPYFVTKRETAKAFLKKAGLPIVRF